MTTVHANSPMEALLRIETLALSAGDTSEAAVSRQLRTAVDVVVQMERNARGRTIVEIDDDLGSWS
jgi:Flp pilus assembly CpaF family ATPase